MPFPDRFLEQVEPLQHPEAEASAAAEVADLPEVEQLLLLRVEQEPLQPEHLPELLQQELLQEQQPEEVPQERQVQPVNLLQPVEQPVHPREQKLIHLQVQKLIHPQVRNQILPEVQARQQEPLLLPRREPVHLPVQKHRELSLRLR